MLARQWWQVRHEQEEQVQVAHRSPPQSVHEQVASSVALWAHEAQAQFVQVQLAQTSPAQSAQAQVAVAVVMVEPFDPKSFGRFA
ncbi:hypothetical protein G5C51_12685 [Streptomyces sp. A7024]|uniref:Uncharacterized protein n=1 Tax=Streptomyces coryli TaxID=1128680 RepID=A0A6G4TXP7_9ACTN|nr:hypothetical protein [Streptomyces coryli]NGN64755.1 hypothetical protein [Streptomyces coryli]